MNYFNVEGFLRSKNGVYMEGRKRFSFPFPYNLGQRVANKYLSGQGLMWERRG